jgi:hypothetical protein
MTRMAPVIPGLVATVMLCGCSAGAAHTVAVRTQTLAARAPTPAESPVYVDACPLSHLRGVRAVVDDVPTGVAIRFAGPERVLYLLRGNVYAMAAASDREGNPFVICPCGDYGASGGAQAMRARSTGELGVTSMQPPSSPPPLLPAAATVNETLTGATLVLTGADDAEVAALRSSTRRAVHAMAECLSEVSY